MRVARTASTHMVGQTFIYQRSPLRWWMHQSLFWGCLLAVAITFPLVFGWIHFGSAPDDQMTYVTYLFGFPTASFEVRTVVSWLLFHGLDIAAVLVLVGISLSLWRRMRDRGALAVQSFADDLFPLVLLFAISVTGLGLTASATWMRGAFYHFLSVLHAITVDRRAAVPAVREVLPHLPAAGAAGREALSGGRRADEGAALRRDAASASRRGCTSTT